MSIKMALLLYFGMIGVAMVAACPHFVGLLLFWAFPLGIAEYVDKMIPLWRDVLPAVVAYGTYVAFLVLFVVVRKEGVWFYVVLGSFAIVLAANVVGCRRQIHEWKNHQPDSTLWDKPEKGSRPFGR